MRLAPGQTETREPADRPGQTDCLAALMNTVLTYLSTTSLVRMTSRLKKTGLPNSWSTALSISGCLRMKFNTESGSVAVSLWQVPGRGSGTLEFSTGSQALFEVACSLNLPGCAKKGWERGEKHQYVEFSWVPGSMLHLIYVCQYCARGDLWHSHLPQPLKILMFRSNELSRLEFLLKI